MKLSRVLCICSLLLVPCSFVTAAPPPASRISLGIGSAEKVLDSLEYAVVTLAEKKSEWENNIFPNLDIFLIGVATDQPIRFDMLLDEEHGRQTQPFIPIAELKDFLQDNLAPIDINSDRSRTDRNLYELTGTVYEGWLRYLPEPIPYAAIFPSKEQLSTDMETPEKVNKAAGAGDALAFLYMKHTADTKQVRAAAMKTYTANALEEIQKAPDETREQYDLRRELRAQTLALMQQWLVETAEVKWQASVDTQKGTAPGDLTFSALPETELKSDINLLAEKGSQFGKIQAPKDAVLAARIHFPIADQHKAGIKKVYELARPVTQQRIDADKDASEKEKAARKEVAPLMYDVLDASADELKSIDGFIDVFPSNGKHAMVMGIAAAGTDKINQIIEKFGGVVDGWSVKMNVETVGDVKIHALDLGDELPKSLSEFYGDSGVIYLGVGKNAFWLAGGEGSLDALKSRITTASQPGEADGILLSLNMHVHPVLKNVHEYLQEANLDILKVLNNRMKSRAQQRSEKREDEERPGRVAGNLANFEWEDTAIAAMAGMDDTLEILIKREGDGVLHGTSNAQKGLIKAVGAVVAKFSEENLQ